MAYDDCHFENVNVVLDDYVLFHIDFVWEDHCFVNVNISLDDMCYDHGIPLHIYMVFDYSLRLA
jgi:hypothetical protein